MIEFFYYKLSQMEALDILTIQFLLDSLTVILNDWLTVSVLQGDICNEPVEMIVNPANSSLSHGGGLAAQIATLGGREIMESSLENLRVYGQVETGSCVVLTSGQLRTRGIKYVCHAVGPSLKRKGIPDKEEINQLKSVIQMILLKADQNYCKSVAIPGISSGIFGYPKRLCAKHIFESIEAFAKQPISDDEERILKTVRLTNIDQETFNAFKQEFISRYSHTDKHIVKETKQKQDLALNLPNTSEHFAIDIPEPAIEAPQVNPISQISSMNQPISHNRGIDYSTFNNNRPQLRNLGHKRSEEFKEEHYGDVPYDMLSSPRDNRRDQPEWLHECWQAYRYRIIIVVALIIVIFLYWRYTM
ncbi:hypothetical protein FGO68_gene15810 [Halteria grandinella]|uniref:Macro domain-containing protein n=1 Tax=Halteria grandinella TaxID=5974 RepID=A0A8J8T123_HALGN|nr:hypothetical protein FGO68_gene15810 [Halteria grandinella]